MHLGSITSFKRAAGIEPNMHYVEFSFNLSNRRHKGQVQSTDMHWFVVRWCCWTTKSRTHSYLGLKRKVFSNNTLDKFNSFSSRLTKSLEHHSLRNAIPKISIFRETPFVRTSTFSPAFFFLVDFFRVINDRGATRTLFYFIYLFIFFFKQGFCIFRPRLYTLI